MAARATALDWIRLLRLPNHATVVADVAAGYLVAAGLRGDLAWPGPEAWWAVGAGVALYAAGMVLNDAYDLDVDRMERPERPLPRGVIARSTAFAVGGVLLVVGAAAACGAAFASASPWPAFVGVGLVLAIWSYDSGLKATAWGPVAMGICRALAWLLGLTAGGGPHGPQWLLPLGMGTYVAGITIFARDEALAVRASESESAARGPDRLTLRLGAAVMAAGLVLSAVPVWRLFGGDMPLPGTALPVSNWLLLWGIISASILVRSLPALVSPAPASIQAAVGNAILSIITLDAILVLAECGERWAFVILSLLVVPVVGRRLVPPT